MRNDDTLARSILEEIGKEGQVTRKYYQRRLPEDPSQDYYYIMRDTKNTSPLLIEYGFIDNPKDVARLQENLLDYVEAVVRAVARYAGVTYVGPDGEVDNVYTVQKGDSLWSIANRFGVTVDALKEANNLTSNTLQVGQRLVIPSTTPTPPSGEYVTYTVKAGDTLYRLAQQFETSIDAIIDANNLQTTVLSVGQILRIPSNVTTTPEEPTPPATQVYTVQRGDSLWKIAQQFGVSVADLIAANNLTTNTLQVGQQLIIPGSGTVTPPTTTTYTVQRGDSLWSIANRFGVTVNAIRNANNLTSDTLQIGQVLTIPSSSGSTGPTTTTYTVQRGDSLWKIANQFQTTVDTLKQLNNLTSNTLQIGQVLKVPA